MPDDLDLRKLRYFVAVAETLHFARAAEELHIAQPVLSRQIRALETELGVTLFSRTTQGTRLTEAGERLLDDARSLIFQASAIVTRLRRPASAERITVGFMPGLLMTPAVATFEELHPGMKARAVRVDWSDQIESVRSGNIDVVFAREPFDHSGLEVTPLFDEPRDAVLPADHRLATRTSATIAELATELLLQDPSACPEWAAHATVTLRRQAAEGATASTVEEKLERVAARRGIVILPRSTAEFYRRPDVAVVPISDIAPNRVALIRASGHTDPLIDSFITVAYQKLGQAS